ncbi:MAG: TetR family transcriptional regulator, partial [Actinomycetes bacterium]
EHRRARRDELVLAAVRAVRRHGAGVGMDDVAAEAGTSKTVVYRYFGDKGDLYLAVCRHVADRLLGQLAAPLHAPAEPRAQLAGAIDAYLSVIEADPEVYRFVVHAPLPDRPVADDPVAGLSSLVGAHVAGVIADRLAAAGKDTSAAGPWGHGLVGMVRSAADHWLADGNRMTREQLRDHLTDLVWAGLAGVLAAAGLDHDSRQENP